MRYFGFILVFLLMEPQLAEAQRLRGKTDTLTVVSYNIENFFNPTDDPEKNDDDFTPEGAYHWTESRLRIKAGRIARVISSVNGWNIPDIVGLCEIEGPEAVELLLRRGRLRRYYEGLCFPTSDGRGIATAMLYRKDRVEVLHSQAIVTSSPERRFFTRDILYAKIAVSRDTFHIFVNHWPSKRGGGNKSDALRDTVAFQLKQFVDSVLDVSSKANVIIMGDFNDSETSACLTSVLGTSNDASFSGDNSSKYLFNLSTLTSDKSYKYRGVWRTIDHIIVARSMLDRYTCSFAVYAPPYLLYPEQMPYVGEKPLRTFLGQKYNDGYSDHLPVIAKFVLKDSINEK